MAQAINDELYNYEDELWDPSDEEAWVSRIFSLMCPLPPEYIEMNISINDVFDL